MVHTLHLRTTRRDALVDLTADVRAAVRDAGVRDGLCHIASPHTTGGVLVNEGYDPDVARDVLMVLDRLVPWTGGYQHAEGNTAAHLKAILCGSSQTLAIRDGELRLGQWQAVFFAEFDGPRQRRVELTIVETAP